jgi:lipopolysaccharide transport system permease protein
VERPVTELATTDAPAEERAAGSPTVVRIAPSSGWRFLSLGELWDYRELGLLFAWRDVKVRYKQTALGAAWALLQPLLTMALFYVFFGRLAKVPSDGISYPVFALAALTPWMFFANSLLLGSNSLVLHAPLIGKMYFPRLLIPLGVLLGNLVDFAITFVVLVIVVLATGDFPGLQFLSLPFFFALCFLATLGVSGGLAALNVRFRDVRYVIPFLTQVWLFATPVAYPDSLLDQPWRTLLALNPMTGVVDGFRWAVAGAPLELATVLVSTASGLAMLAVGLLYFSHAERTFADIA